MSGLKKMILLPEEMLEKFIGLSEKVESYSEGEGKGVSPDVFDSNTVDKTLDHLKTNLASILNSEKLDRSKVMEYKNDLLKLINMQDRMTNPMFVQEESNKIIKKYIFIEP